jgi:signal transduction histidine kinase
MISYSKTRKIFFWIYVILTLLFSSLLIYLGKKDIDRANAFAEREKTYIDNIMNCSEKLNKALSSLHGAMLSNNPAKFSSLEADFLNLKKQINSLSPKNGDKNIQRDIEALKKNMMRISSALDSLRNDLLCFPPDIDILTSQDYLCISSSLSASSEIIHALVSKVNEQANFLREQSLFFFKKLQYTLVTFFILTTLFAVSSSSYSSFLLKKYLKLLSEGTKQISSGNLKYRFASLESDEMGSLMSDFNVMARRLEQQTVELKEINRKIEEKATQLAEANLHKDRFFANMSHELRTPLNSIIGFSELIIERNNYDKVKIVENSRKILSAAEHLLALISGLLDIAKADAGVLLPNRKEHEITKTVAETVEMLKPLAEKKNLSLDLLLPPPMKAYYDEKMMRQVLINVIGNSIKFTKEGWVKVKIERTGDMIKIEVSDTGIGISDEEQKKIFKDFHRVENGLTSNYEGVGLGLALSRRLIELHSGTIQLSSALGKGSSFRILIP